MDLFTEIAGNIMQQYLWESPGDFHRIGIFPGAFKPPHLGHYNVIRQACQENDEVFVFVSKNPRPINEECKDSDRFCGLMSSDKYVGNLGDIKTVTPKFGDVSATLVRKAIQLRDTETLYKNLPQIPEKGEIIDLLLSSGDEITIEQTMKILSIYKPHLEESTGAQLSISISAKSPVTDTYDKVAEINDSRDANNIAISLYAGDK